MVVRVNRYVIRVDSEARRTHGWHARIQPVGGTTYRSKLFSDKKYGGKRAAKALAEFWAYGRMPRVGRDGRR